MAPRWDRGAHEMSDGAGVEVIYRDGKPVAVILDIEEYREMLERLEDAEDLAVLEEMREKPLSFRRLDEFLDCRHLAGETGQAGEGAVIASQPLPLSQAAVGEGEGAETA